MKNAMNTIKSWFGFRIISTAFALALLVSCGGGSSGINKVLVMGDSLYDSGTFGFKFTVQGAPNEPLVVPELVTQSFGLSAQCNFYSFSSTTGFSPNTTNGCTNFAIGGGRINNAATAGISANDPRIIVNQLQTASQTNGYTANDLVMVIGGGNDAADIAGLYLAIGLAAPNSQAQSDAIAAYGQAITSIVPSGSIDLTTQQGLDNAGAVYMNALATLFYQQIKAQTLDKGARRVVVTNIPPITLTPRFQAVLANVALAYGGGSTGQAASDAIAGLFDTWVSTFNSTLSASVSGNLGLLLIDINTSIKDQVNNPTAYGLTNVQDAACPVTGVGTDGLPTYDFPTCTSAALSSQTPPTGATGGANWWKTYYFSDGFHPTPLAHQLAFQQLMNGLTNKGWR